MWNLWLILLFSDGSSVKGVLAQGIAEPETASAKKSASQLSQKSQASQSSTAFRDDTPSQSASRQSVYEEETPKPRESRLRENNIKQEKQDRVPRSSSVDRYYILFCISIYLVCLKGCISHTSCEAYCHINFNMSSSSRKTSRSSTPSHRPVSASTNPIHIPSSNKQVSPKYNVVQLLEKGHTLRFVQCTSPFTWKLHEVWTLL